MNPFKNPTILLVLLLLLFISLVVLAVLFYLYSKQPKQKKNEETTNRFSSLIQIDEEMKNRLQPTYDHLSFLELCENFRNFSAGELGLYYSMEDIRRFITGLAVSHIMILQGMSGTGKTSLAYAFGRFTGNDSEIIPVQPMWKERTDLIGYYNEFTKKFNETPFLEALYRANYKEDMFITILDEMNIARVEYYFAEFLSLLEIPDAESRYIDVVSESMVGDPKLLKNGAIKLPDNMWFIGTANNDDSTFSISDKVYDRAMIMNLDKRATPFDAKPTGVAKIHAKDFYLEAKRVSDGYQMSSELKNKINTLDQYLQENYYISFGNRINKQIHEYLAIYMACGGKELEALDDILAKKVFRKLAGGSRELVKKNQKELFAYLDEVFGENTLTISKEAIEHIAKNAR